MNPITLADIWTSPRFQKTVTVADLGILVAAGFLKGAEVIQKFCINEDVGTSTPEDIQSQGGFLTRQTVAQNIELISTSVNDNASGTGVQQIQVEGVDENLNFAKETMTMDATDGTIASAPSTTTFLAIHEMRSSRRGTITGYNDGNITARVQGGGDTMLEMPLSSEFGGLGTSTSSHYCVPNGKTAFLYQMLPKVETSKKIHLSVNIKFNAGDVVAPFNGLNYKALIWSDVEINQPGIEFRHPIILPPKTEIWARGKANTSSGSMALNYGLLQFDEIV